MWRELEYELEGDAEFERLLRQPDATFAERLRPHAGKRFAESFNDYDVIDSRIDTGA